VSDVLSSVSPRKHFLLFSTRDPPALQRIPWPEVEDEGNNQEEEGEEELQKTLGSYDTWVLNDHDFGWMVESEGKYSVLSVLFLSLKNQPWFRRSSFPA
jgi:hypothetical protein